MLYYTFKDGQWLYFLFEEKTTCQMELPLENNPNANVKQYYKDTTFDSCRTHVTELATKDLSVEFYFWSDQTHTIFQDIECNCIAFKSCDENSRVPLEYAGTTFRYEKCKEGKYKIINILI